VQFVGGHELVFGKIALEEHFALPETLADSTRYASGQSWSLLEQRLLDLHDHRVSQMDAHGIAYAILSLNSPAIQAIANRARAIEIARRANDVVADAVARKPNRLGAFAALPLQDPDAAAEELTRAVRELGFKGALVNGFSQVGGGEDVVYYDHPAYAAFWQQVEGLDVPFYLHPREPLPSREPIYEGHPWLLGPVWAFAAETAVHALRLMCSGLFDRHPRLTLILGHLGEGLPYNAWRIDHRLRKMPQGLPARRTITEYLRSNVFLTTSGNFRTPTLVDAIAEVGADRVLFSVDYPFEEPADAAEWFDSAPIPDRDRFRIGSENATRLFRL
jgi:predicted TIM-barrel fold metal-dependent hydrolase